MPNVEDLGRKIKAKYPGQYDDLSDAEVGRRVKATYPGSYDDFVEASPVVVKSSSPPVLSTPTVYTNAHPEPINAETDQLIYRIFSVVCWAACVFLLATVCSAGSGGAIWGQLILGIAAGIAGSVLWKKANEAYTEEAREISLKTDIKRNQITYKHEEIREKQAESEIARNLELASMRQETQARSEIATQNEWELRNELLTKARERGMDVPTYLSVEQKKAFNQADLDNELAKMREQVRLAIIAKHFSNHQMISLISEQLDTLYLRIEEIRESNSIPEAAKRRMIEDREEYITTLKEDRRGRQKRLLEAHNGGDVSGDDQDTDI